MNIVYRSVKGSKLTSDEVDGNFQYLESLVGGHGNNIISESGFELVGQDLTIAAGWIWRILNISYTNSTDVVLNIPLASSGNQRIDLIVANQSNTFERVVGVESTSNPTAPPVPTNKILVTFMAVTDGDVGAPIDPILGTSFKKKSENLGYGDDALSGTEAVILLRPEGSSYYALGNAGLVSIDGFGLDLITGNPSAEVPYPLKDLFIQNTGTSSFVLLHDGAGDADSKFFFLDETDLEVPAGGIVWLKYNITACQLFFKSWSDVDLSTKVDKVSTAGVERAYIINADGSQGTKATSEFGISLSDLQRYSLYAWRPTPNGWYGFSTPTIIGTADNQSPVFSGNDFIKAVRRRYVSASTAGSSVEFHETSFRQTSLGDGFFFSMKFGNEDVASVADARLFAGLYGLNAIGNVNPSTLASMIAVAADSGDTNLQFMHNDSAGTAVKVDLGSNFPANTIATDLYCFQMYNVPGASSVWYRLINISTKVETAWVEVTTELPAVNQILLPHCWRNNGTTALAVRLSLVDFTLYKRI